MDGVVIVAERSGALLHTRSFSAHFDRLHPKSERMNLGALLFALQNFAGNSIHATSTARPPITLFETAAERILLARSQLRELLIALFVRPSLDVTTAKSLVERIAHNYDHDQRLDSRLSAVFNQQARMFRDTCHLAIRNEVQSCLQGFATTQCFSGDLASEPTSPGFVLFQFAPSSDTRTTASSGDGNDEDKHDFANLDSARHVIRDDDLKDSRLASPRLVETVADPSQRLQKLSAFSRSLHPLPRVSAQKPKLKKNAVMSFVEPETFHQLLLLPPTAQSSPSANSDGNRTKLLHHPQFAPALLDALQSTMKSIATFMILSDKTTILRTVKEGTWRAFPLPDLLAPSSGGRVAVNMQFWNRDGCLLIYVDPLPAGSHENTFEKTHVEALFDKLEPLARCTLKLST